MEIAGTAVGVVNLFPFLGGAVYMQLLGWVLDHFPSSTVPGGFTTEGYTRLLLVLFISSLVALGCTLLMKETFKKDAR